MARRHGETSPSSPRTRPCIENVPGAQGIFFNVTQRVWNPPTDVYESDKAIIIRMEAAGVHLEDIEITIEGNLLVIRGRRRQPPGEAGSVCQALEIHYGDFERVFELPPRLLLKEVQSSFHDGFLQVIIQKTFTAPRLVPITDDSD